MGSLSWRRSKMATILFAIHLDLPDTFLYLAGTIAIAVVGGFALGAYATYFTKRRKLKRLRGKILPARARLVAAIDTVAATTGVRASKEQATDALSERRLNARLDLATARHTWKRAIAEWEDGAIEIVRTERKLLVDERRLAVERAVKDDLKPPTELELWPLLRDVELQIGNPAVVLLENFCKLVREKKMIMIIFIIFTSIALAIGAVFLFTHSAGGWIAILIAVAATLALTNLFVAHGTEKFLWYGVSVFFSVVVFGAALKVVYTLDHPQVQPVALLRKQNAAGLCGVFVAQTSERVYIGRLPTISHPHHASEGRRGLIFWVPASEVDIVSVGQLVSTSILREQATTMLRRLYKDRAEELPPTLKNETTTTVTGAEVPPGAKTGTQKTVVTESPAKKYGPSPRTASMAAPCEPQSASQHKKL